MMVMKLKRSIKLRGAGRFPGRRLPSLLFCMIAILQPSSTIAQSVEKGSTPTATVHLTEVKEAGYSLKPTGLATAEWPLLRLDFSIEREDHTPFRNLSLADVQPKIDGQPLAVRDGDLRLRENEAAEVLLLLDGSGSMSGHGVEKLRAAVAALKTLINDLRPTDRVALAAFDQEPRMIVPLSADKQLILSEIENFKIRPERSKFTRLYGAVDFALVEAKKQNIRNVIVISDGCEDTPESRALSPAALSQYKHEQEQALADFSRKNDIRVYTVAIGDEHGSGLNYVDRATLANISAGASGGRGAYIELTAAMGDAAWQESYLRNRLQQTFDDVRQSFRYSYSLMVHLDETRPRDALEHKLWVGFTIGDSPRVQLPVEYTFVWPSSGPPVVKAVVLQRPIFIQSAPRSVKWRQLLLIYSALLAGLTALACLPALGRRFMGQGEARRLGHAIQIVDGRSPFLGAVCPNEGAAGRPYLIQEGDVVVICPQPECQTAHHLDCWCFNHHQCMNRICEFKMVVPVSVLEKYGLKERGLN